ncbi:MAG: penicillin-binding transpeptidase domain-containing protein [Planctomycetota bacterium]|jgi:cell division protein FtsI/penicillin-binding protein 2
MNAVGITAGERARLRIFFGAFGATALFLSGWLAYVQVAQAGSIPRKGRAPLPLSTSTADAQGQRRERVPSPRGAIVDRRGNLLAVDCESYEVRADIVVPHYARVEANAYRAWLARLVDAFSLALVADPGLADRADARRRHVERIATALHRELKTGALPPAGKIPKGHPVRADVLIASRVDALPAIEALRRLATEKWLETVNVHFLRGYDRAYPERDLTYGLVGHTETSWVGAGADAVLTTRGVSGLETLPELQPAPGTTRAFLADGKRNPYFLAPLDDAPKPLVLHSTVDLDLQRIAVKELSAVAEAGAREGKVTIPKWGAMVLVELATGDVLAAASWHRDARNPTTAQFTPSQSLYEPGSVVKPLVLAYAHEAGKLDWGAQFDCAPGSADYRERIANLGRRKPVRDDHECHVLDARGIVVNSSNIGAAYVGLMLEREEWEDYMACFGFGRKLGWTLPHSVGGTNKRSFARDIPLRSFKANSVISFSFGYELQVNTMQLARAYLRLFRGRDAEVRLVRGATVGGEWQPAPSAIGGRTFRPAVVDAVRAAMADVVSADPHATGVHMHRNMLKELGIDLHGVVGGKTGTADSTIGIPGRGRVNVRNASFVGFLPADAPRWLAVCVLQKDDSARFYGGSYAAPPVVRLLLQCQQLEERRLLRQESQDEPSGQARDASGSPGDTGWSDAAPESNRSGR